VVLGVAAPLPEGRRDPEGERVYLTQLVGEPVIGALGRLTAIFGRALRTLAENGRAGSELLEELLLVAESFDPAEFWREAITASSS
jgi:hypothetical protein